MTLEPTRATEMQNHELNEALDADAAEDLDGLSIKNQRLARIDEYEESAVSRSDPLAAVIGMGSAVLQRVFEDLGAAVLEVLDTHPHTLDNLRELTPEIRLMLSLRNAIEKDLDIQTHDA